MTAVSAIVFFLGLLFGFQRPSRLLLPRLRATVSSRLHPIQPRGRFLYFEVAFLSSDRCRSVSPLRLVGSQHRAAALCFFLFSRRGAEPTAFPPSLSTHFVDSFFHPLPALSPARLPPLRGLRLLPPPRPESTPLVDFVFRLSLRSSGGPGSPVRLRLPVRGGAASTASPLGSQLPSSTLFFPPTPTLSLARRLPGRGGAASTTPAWSVNSVPPTPYSSFRLSR